MITIRNTWSPAREMLTLRDAMDRLFDDRVARLTRPEGWEGETVVTPPADAWEDADFVVIELALPGAVPEKVEVRYEKDLLTVSGEFAPRDAERQWLLQERARGPFRRQFTLRAPVEAERAEAHFADGVLTLTLPKSDVVKPRKIAVQSA